MSDIDRKNADIQEEVIESRRKLKLTGNLTEKEIEEFINFQFYIGPDTVKEQLRRYFLMVKVCRPDLASKLQIELDEKIGNSIDNNLDLSIVDIAIILNKYVSGFLIRYNGSLYYKSKGELKIM